MLRSLQISHERSDPINAVRYNVDESVAIEFRVSQCPADRLTRDRHILGLVIGIKRVPIFVHNIVDVVDIGLSNHEHINAHDCANDSHEDHSDLHDDADDVEQSFHNAHLQVLNEVSRSDSSFLLHRYDIHSF